jgi:hypothetical protein
VLKSILDWVTLAVEGLVMVAWLLAILAWRYLRLQALAPGLSNDGVTVTAFVGNQRLGINTLNQACSLSAIRPGTFRSNNSDRHTKRTHGQM